MTFNERCRVLNDVDFISINQGRPCINPLSILSPEGDRIHRIPIILEPAWLDKELVLSLILITCFVYFLEPIFGRCFI